jgi:hypothetical protein
MNPTLAVSQLLPEHREVIARLIEKSAKTGTVNVIVGLELADPYAPEAQLPDPAAVAQQRAAITQARGALLASLRTAKATEYAKWDSLPLMALRVDAAALRLLAESPLITTIQEDRRSTPMAPEHRAEITRLIDKAAKTGTVNVIVGLHLAEPYAPEAQLPNAAAVARQRAAIAQARAALLGILRVAKATEYAKWDPLPLMALRVDAAALRLLADTSLVATIKEDGLSRPQ